MRTDVPFKDLTEQEKDIVYNGPAEKKTILYKAKKGNTSGELDFTYYNAVFTVENALAKVTDEKGMKRVEKFLISEVCPCCHGSRLSEKARAPHIDGIGLDVATEKSLDDAVAWVKHVPETLPEERAIHRTSSSQQYWSNRSDEGLGCRQQFSGVGRPRHPDPTVSAVGGSYTKVSKQFYIIDFHQCLCLGLMSNCLKKVSG